MVSGGKRNALSTATSKVATKAAFSATTVVPGQGEYIASLLAMKDAAIPAITPKVTPRVRRNMMAAARLGPWRSVRRSLHMMLPETNSRQPSSPSTKYSRRTNRPP